ncbi:MAG: diaminopimelate epimerase [Myxococcota bacterium]|jgi:diaminopimelate epimerase
MLHILTAAGGNPTALWLQDTPLSRTQYAERGGDLMTAGAALIRLRGGESIPEQAGFLLRAERHLEMTGGELCGNATLSAAALLGAHLGLRTFEMTTSDHPRRCRVSVALMAEEVVRCTLSGLTLERTDRVVNGQPVAVVDMGGIVHVLIEADFPVDFRARHRDVAEALGLSERAAVGVCWFHREDGVAVMEPVVRVQTQAGETFIHESACGSGSIALSVATGCATIRQPTGEPITVQHTSGQTMFSARIQPVLSAALR